MKTIPKFFLLTVMILFSASLSGQKQIISISPEPVEMTYSKGRFILTPQTKIYVDNMETSGKDAAVFNEYLSENYGFSLSINQSQKYDSNSIVIKKSVNKEMPQDAYRMDVSSGYIIIEGKDAGVFYALQSLKQLLPAYKTELIKIRNLRIYDYPTYSWRGMHLDVCRHFFTTGEVKKYIDLIAFYKMNVFHWHLTDDQGWRIQIDKYPKLTSVGGYRNRTLIGHASDTVQRYDSIRYGGFYTKEQIREVIAYAASRHVQIVPEIEMPGHALAALSAYPEYSCSGGPFETAGSWGVFEDVFCTKDKTIHFLEDVLAEVMELFPGKYIHIGGDECPKTRWEKCPECRKVMKKEGLKDGHELQSYVIRTIEKFVNSKGKSIIGWDEILEGGLAPNAAVMSWRGADGGIAAAKMKHYVVMCPGEFCYLDHYQGDPATEPLAFGGYTPLEKVYSYNPMPDSLPENLKKYILGAQGNLWTEYITDFNHLQYMALPRMIALSEVLWTNPKIRDYERFLMKLQKHTETLDMLKVNYKKPTK
ncbi:MAG TPA: beta-N-acetylhexosaminidase [Bacteroidales bacterium]|nr:beta-N-acetylhexosaminidase [Bacteroidales bacterium]